MDQENQNSDISQGKMVLRYEYPDGRITAMTAIAGEWQITVFPSREDAIEFAAQHFLIVQDPKANDTPN